MPLIVQQAVIGLILGSAYAIAGVTFGLLYRTMKVFHFAFASIGVAGAFVAVIIAGGSSSWYRILAGIVGGMALAGLLTVAANSLLYRRLTARGATTGTTFISALAIGLIVEAVLALLAGPQDRQFTVVAFTSQHRLAGLPTSGLLALAIALFVIVPLAWRFYMRDTSIGQQTDALISNPEVAEVVGIRTGALTAGLVFGVGATSALAFIVAGMNSSVSVPSAVPLTLFGVLAMLCGGVDSIWGTAVAGLLIGVLSNVAAVTISSQWATVIVFVVAMVVVLVRPAGGVRKANA